jgi:hypothetical protein
MNYRKPFYVDDTSEEYVLTIRDADDMSTTHHHWDHQIPDNDHPIVIEDKKAFIAFVHWQCAAMNQFEQPQ